jgi:glycosyltransferase involved in cell wall biosynthesis
MDYYSIMKIKALHPLISCICITDNRPAMLLKSILSFDQQNYPNAELVISYPNNDKSTKNLISQLKQTSAIRLLEIVRHEKETIGVARNKAVEKCNGDYVCMWDDDDIYFFSRISDQYNLLQGNRKYFQASVVSQIILFDVIKDKGYLSFPYRWSGSLLCRKQHFLAFPCIDANEFECAPLINYLNANHLLLQSDLSPQLYIYVYHGQNKTDKYSFQYLTRKSAPLEQNFSKWISANINQEIKLNV